MTLFGYDATPVLELARQVIGRYNALMVEPKSGVMSLNERDLMLNAHLAGRLS